MHEQAAANSSQLASQRASLRQQLSPAASIEQRLLQHKRPKQLCQTQKRNGHRCRPSHLRQRYRKFEQQKTGGTAGARLLVSSRSNAIAAVSALHALRRTQLQ